MLDRHSAGVILSNDSPAGMLCRCKISDELRRSCDGRANLRRQLLQFSRKAAGKPVSTLSRRCNGCALKTTSKRMPLGAVRTSRLRMVICTNFGAAIKSMHTSLHSL